MGRENTKTGNGKSELREVLGRCKNAFMTVGVFSFFQNLLMLTLPVYMLQVYDRVLLSRSIDTLIMLTIVAVGLLTVGGVLEMLRSKLLLRIGNRMDEALSKRTFAGIIERKAGDSGGPGSRPISDLENIRGYLASNGLVTFFDAPWTPLFILLIFVMHPLLGAVALVGAVLLILLALFSELLTRTPVRRAAGENAASYTFAESTMRNAHVAAALGMIDGLFERWRRHHHRALLANASAGDRSAAVTALAKYIRQLLQIGILGFGAYLAVLQEITPGVMIAASIIMGRALAPVEQAINAWRSFVSARAATGRLSAFLEETPVPEAATELPKPQGHVRVEGVFGGPPGTEKPVLKNFGFDLPFGQVLGVVGPSAAGKSTLASFLVGVWAPTTGSVRLDGAEVSSWDSAELGPHIGYLPQEIELFGGTVAENIARFGPVDAEGVIEAAKKARAHEMILRLPDGYDTAIGEGGNVLSGGQRQRIGLARALFGDPSLIVLDEPNSNLDNEGEVALRDAITDLKEAGKTVVIITHRPTVLAVTDLLLVIVDGAVDRFGPRQEIMTAMTKANVRDGATPTAKPAVVGR